MGCLGIISDTTPRISWNHVDNEGDPQDGYQVQIDRAPTFDSNNGSPDFDSGIISSINNYHDVFPALTVYGKLYVRVRTREANHNIAESAWSSGDYFIFDSSIDVVGVDRPVFYATISTDPDNDSLHFRIQIDSIGDFTSPILDKSSAVDQTGWEYWNGSSWIAIPAGGVPSTYYGNQVRYNVQAGDALPSFATYAFRIRAEEA